MPKGIYKRTEETRRKISILKKGKPLSVEHRNKLSESKKGKKRPPFSEEWKNNMGHTAWNKGLRNPNAKRRIPGFVNWQKNSRNRSLKRLRIDSGFHTFGEWELLKKQYGYICPCCKLQEPDIKLTVDHIIPLSKGGTDLIDNIQPLCMKCNVKKHTKVIKY